MTLILLILILGILIFVHELGHFIFAKIFKVHVYEFALGMGPKLFSFRRKNKNDETLYSLRLLPIGGFCAMAGEEGEDDESLPKDKFMCNKPKYQRFIILIAGVTFNFILALILLFTQSLIWGHSEERPVVGNLKESFPAEIAGLNEGDTILKVNGKKTRTWDLFVIQTNLKQDKNEYTFEVEKANGEKKTYTLSKQKDMVEDQEVEVFGFERQSNHYTGFVESIKYSLSKFGSTISSMFIIIKALFTGKLGLSSFAGPVGMYSIVGGAAASGIYSLIYLTAYLSINLGFINAIPFPAFDGGRIVFIGVEAITKKKVNPSVEATFHTIGFILLILLMLFITINDVIRLF